MNEFLFLTMDILCKIVGRKLGFCMKNRFNCFWKISDYERFWGSCFGMGET